MDNLLAQEEYDYAIIQFGDPHKKIDFESPMTQRYIVYIRDARDVDGMTPTSFPKDVALVTNSAFIAKRVGIQTGRQTSMLIPYVEKNNYLTESDGSFVSFINPVAVKGLDLAIEIAKACPEIPFLFLQCWPLPFNSLRRLKMRIKAVPNIKLKGRVLDMRKIYRQTRILLVPSQWEEAWGRIVTESQFSGIPVVASNIGGLKESTGEGGVLLSPTSPINEWVEAIRKLYWCSGSYDVASKKAMFNAEKYWSRAHNSSSELLKLINHNE
jgi:glycosyltransferase involved in cell wall biosynthesis